MAESKLQIVIDAKNNADQGFSSVANSIEGLNQKVSLAGKLLISYFSFNAVKNFITESVQAFGMEEQAIARLETVMKNINGATNEQIQSLKDYAAQLQKTTTFADDQIISAQAMLGTFQLNTEQIKKITPRILDMGAAMQKSSGAGADLESITIAVGKAMTSGIGSLSRYGVVITEAQEKAFELSNTQEKVNIITQALDANFKGVAEGSAHTFWGKMQQLKNTTGEFQEEIGRAVMVLTSDMVWALGANAEGFNENLKATNSLILSVLKLKEGIYGYGLAVLEIFGKAKEWGATAGKWTIGLAGSIAESDFSSMDYFQKQIDETKNKTAEYRRTVGDLALEIDQMSKEIKDGTFNWDAYLGKVNDAKNKIPPLTIAMGGSGKEAKKLADEMEKLQDSFVGYTSKASDAFQSVSEKIKGIKDEISSAVKSAHDEMNKLTGGYNQENSDATKSMAEEYVKQEQKVADLKAQWGSESDQKKKNELLKELKVEQAALDSRKTIELAYLAEVNEARRRASLTEFERSMEDLNQKKTIIRDEFQIKAQGIKDELKTKLDKLVDELAIENSKLVQIKNINDQALSIQSSFLSQKEKMTEESVKQEIKLYNKLAEAMNNAKQGKATQITSGPSVSARASELLGQVININISGNTVMDENSFRQMLNRSLIEPLKRNAKIAY